MHRAHTSGFCSALQQLSHSLPLLTLSAAASSVLGICCHYSPLSSVKPFGPTDLPTRESHGKTSSELGLVVAPVLTVQKSVFLFRLDRSLLSVGLPVRPSPARLRHGIFLFSPRNETIDEEKYGWSHPAGTREPYC